MVTSVTIQRGLSVTWSPDQYLAFENERSRPSADLLNALPRGGAKLAVDLGCGPGNSTELLAAHFPEAEIVGVDSSEDMLAAARKRLPHVRFELADISGWSAPGPFDVIMANAVLQWVPGHQELFPRLVSKLSPGGHLAVQAPCNFEEPAHSLMREIAAQKPWAGKFGDPNARRARVQSPEWYFSLLRPLCRKAEVWRTTYYHHLAGGADALVEWFKATGLRPFLAPLDESERAAFLAKYRAGMAEAYPALDDGSVLLPFPRLFIVGTR
jgi:trans-aconitate 2-methyltransferase